MPGSSFGRDCQIRALYDAVTAPELDPIILFYGQSGVGKSSVLDAGLLPRLEESHQLRYLRRDQTLGLTGTLMTALDGQHESSAAAWRAIEAAADRPLLIVLDQAEEAYTRPNPRYRHELADLADALHGIFTDPANRPRPRGRLILAFRKEWLAEIDQRLEERDLARTRSPIETIDRRGIIEAITGPTRTPRLRTKYRLEIDKGLAKEIADNLGADLQSPIAPTLQILLTKLWEQAHRIDDDTPRFSRELYLALKKKGILLNDIPEAATRRAGETLSRRRRERTGAGYPRLLHHPPRDGGTAQCRRPGEALPKQRDLSAGVR